MGHHYFKAISYRQFTAAAKMPSAKSWCWGNCCVHLLSKHLLRELFHHVMVINDIPGSKFSKIIVFAIFVLMFTASSVFIKHRHDIRWKDKCSILFLIEDTFLLRARMKWELNIGQIVTVMCIFHHVMCFLLQPVMIVLAIIIWFNFSPFFLTCFQSPSSGKVPAPAGLS